MLGVANTLLRDQDGRLHAHNTDVEGARQAVLGAHGPHACDGHVLVIGAGGAAPAVGLGLARRKLTFINRTREKADRLATHAATDFEVEAHARDWSDLPDAVAEADIIANATTLGMKGQADIDWPLERAKPDAIVFDAVYAPLETTLLQKARARGLRTVDGLDMLIHQGALAFEIWFGIKPDTAKARERLLKIIAARA
jgi:shikimate dehydrogenase